MIGEQMRIFASIAIITYSPVQAFVDLVGSNVSPC